MAEATAIVLLAFSILTFLWAAVGLIDPELAKLPHRLASVGIWGISFALFVFSVTLMWESSDTTPDAEVATAPPRVVSQGELLQAFEENEVRAEQTYRGQTLQLTGLVGSIEGDVWGNGGFIEFQGDFVREVEAHFDDRSVLVDLSRGDRVTVVCRDVDGGNVMGVRLRDCGFSRMETGGTAAVSEVEDAVSEVQDARARSGSVGVEPDEGDTVELAAAEDTASRFVEQGHALLDGGSHDAAAQEYLAALGADPERRDVLFPLSVAQMKSGADDAARLSFAELLEAGLPLELAATHNHTFGNCEGTFRLTRESVSYRSPREDDPDHRFDVPLDGVAETGLRGDESLLIRAPSAEHVEKNEGDSKNWTFRFDIWDANTEVASLISGYLSAGR